MNRILVKYMILQLAVALLLIFSLGSYSQGELLSYPNILFIIFIVATIYGSCFSEKRVLLKKLSSRFLGKYKRADQKSSFIVRLHIVIYFVLILILSHLLYRRYIDNVVLYHMNFEFILLLCGLSFYLVLTFIIIFFNPFKED